jgi:hypothetical protein
MVNFIRKRLQVFVSSTFSDLIPERQAAVEAILSAGHIPAGMELFAAGDESQMEVIKQWIDESDVYLLILGGRYGSVESKTGKSYTQLEYEYALTQGKPLFACVMTESGLDERVKSRGKSVLELENPQKLKEFREQVLTKISKFFDDSKDIKIIVVETLSHFSRREDLVGWIRASEGADMPRLADEIARLSRENAQLRNAQQSNGSDFRIGGLTVSEIKAILKNNGIDFLKEREALESSRAKLSATTVKTLEALGLVEQNLFVSLDTVYQLSKDGRRFLNKLDADSAIASGIQ